MRKKNWEEICEKWKGNIEKFILKIFLGWKIKIGPKEIQKWKLTYFLNLNFLAVKVKWL